MADLLAAYPDPRQTISHASGRTDRPRRAHVIRDGTKQCGRTRLDLTRTLPAADVPEAQRCRSFCCRNQWPP